MRTLILVLVAIAASGAAALAQSPPASDQSRDFYARVWRDLEQKTKQCDEFAARAETNKILPMVAESEKYNVARDVFRKHGCAEADLQRAIAQDKADAAAMTPCQRLVPRARQAVEQAVPNADGAAKYGALVKLMQLYGCMPPDPPRQATDCYPTFSGGFTCTTR